MLHNFPHSTSARNFQVQHNIITFDALLQKSMYSFVYCCFHTPVLLLSNVVYPFLSPCGVGLTYISKSTSHVVIRAKEHLNLGSSVKSKIKGHAIECNFCNKKDTDSLMQGCPIHGPKSLLVQPAF